VVLTRIISVLSWCVKCQAGAFLSDESIFLVFHSIFRMITQKGCSALLKHTAEIALDELMRHLFATEAAFALAPSPLFSLPPAPPPPSPLPAEKQEGDDVSKGTQEAFLLSILKRSPSSLSSSSHGREASHVKHVNQQGVSFKRAADTQSVAVSSGGGSGSGSGSGSVSSVCVWHHGLGGLRRILQCISSFLDLHPLPSSSSSSHRRRGGSGGPGGSGLSIATSSPSLHALGLRLLVTILHSIFSFRSLSLSLSPSPSLSLQISPTIVEFFADDVCKYIFSTLRTSDLRSITESVSLLSLMFGSLDLMTHLQCQLELFLKIVVASVHPNENGEGNLGDDEGSGYYGNIGHEKKELLLNAVVDYFEVNSFCPLRLSRLLLLISY
jgi:hypothetical protein